MGVPGRVSLEDVKQLPSIWSSKISDSVNTDFGSQTQELPPVWCYTPMKTQCAPSRQLNAMPDGCSTFCELKRQVKSGGSSPSTPRRRARQRDGQGSRPQSRNDARNRVTRYQSGSPSLGFRSPALSARSPTPSAASQ